MRIFTSEGAVEIRPLRLRWITSNSFVVAGVGKDAKIRRSHLRFKTPEEASRASTIIKQNPAILEEPLVPVEEFPVQVRLLMTGRYAILQFYILFWRVIVALFIVLVLEFFGLFGLGIGILLAIAYVGIPIWAAFVKARRTIQGWIRVQGRSIVVRTGLDWTPMFPKVIEWKSPTVIVLRGRTKYELTFLSAQELTQAVTKIRAAFPQVQEILSKTYQPGVDAAIA